MLESPHVCIAVQSLLLLTGCMPVATRLEEAEVAASMSMDFRQQHHGGDSLPVAASCQALAAVLLARGQLSEAEVLCRRCLAIRCMTLPLACAHLSVLLRQIRTHTCISAGRKQRGQTL